MSHVTRRDFLEGSLLAAAGLAIPGQATAAASEADLLSVPGPIIDTHVYLFRWPFRRIPGDEPAELVRRLRDRGVAQAWAGSFEGVLHKDIHGVNARLAEACRVHGLDFFVPFGTVNPRLPDWEEDLRRCQETFRMPGIRLLPGYHQYTLDDPSLLRLLELASRRGMLVQLVVWLEDERHQHPRMPVPEVDATPLAGLLGKLPQLRVMLLNASRVPSGKPLLPLFKDRHVWFDIAKSDILDGLAGLMRQMPVERIVFGSFSPMFYFESTLLKLRESPLSESQAREILERNARSLLASRKKGGNRT